MAFDAHFMRCAIEENGGETGTLRDNLNRFWKFKSRFFWE